MIFPFFLMLFSLNSFANPALYDRSGIEAWLNSDIPRGRGFSVRNVFPQGRAMKYCAGAGCKIKIPFAFSEEQLRRVADVMNRVVREKGCGGTEACERLSLQYGVREMDRMVRYSKLNGLRLEEAVRVSINKDNGNEPEFFGDKISEGLWFLRDCVDQADRKSTRLNSSH